MKAGPGHLAGFGIDPLFLSFYPPPGVIPRGLVHIIARITPFNVATCNPPPFPLLCFADQSVYIFLFLTLPRNLPLFFFWS